jgi:carbonic anhydrase/acetyltransferase-like protein (isoleucine patch superfamily)
MTQGNGRASLPGRVSTRVLHLMARVLPGSKSLRPFLHRLRGVSIGRNVFIGDDVYLENEYPTCIEIEDDVEIGLRTVIIAHLRGPGRVVIKKAAWIGACCLISSAKGRVLTIGEGAVIGAGSVVTNDVPAFAFIKPAAPQQVATVAVPLATASSYIAFLRGLRPVRPSANVRDGTSSKRDGTSKVVT